MACFNLSTIVSSAGTNKTCAYVACVVVSSPSFLYVWSDEFLEYADFM